MPPKSRPVYVLLCAAAAAVLTATAAAQVPKAVVTGPREARCGALVVLDATESQGLDRLWLLAAAPEDTSFLPVETRLKCLFASPTPGKYEFVLIVAGQNANGGAAVDLARHTVTLTAGTPPTPPTPPNPPDPPTPPVPTSGRRLLVILRESSAKDTRTATTVLNLRTDETFLQTLRTANHPPPLVLDPDSADPLVARILSSAQRTANPTLKLPLAAVLDYSAGDSSGPILTVVALPPDLAAVQALLR